LSTLVGGPVAAWFSKGGGAGGLATRLRLDRVLNSTRNGGGPDCVSIEPSGAARRVRTGLIRNSPEPIDGRGGLEADRLTIEVPGAARRAADGPEM
jgi:hypothetical protein